jgi:hypothetical protein
MSRSASSLLSLLIFGVLVYAFRNQLKTLFSGAGAFGSSLRGSLGYGVPTQPVPVNFALTSATGDQYSTPPPGYVRNSTGGISALPDPNGIGGGFAT